MSNVLESTDIIDPWLFGVLSGDSVLAGMVGTRISNTLSIVPLATPYITFSASSPPRAVRGVGGTLHDTDSQYTIKAVGTGGSFNQVAAIAARVRTLIDQSNVTISTPIAASLSCYWELEIRYPEETEGVPYRHLGGIYRVRAIAI